MRIGLIVPGFSSDASDWCIPALRHLVRELASEHDVELVALRYPARRDRYSVDGATVHSLGGGRARGLARGPLLARALARLIASHRAAPIEVLHGFWADEPGFVAGVAGRVLGVPAVVSVMGGELARLPGIAYGGRLSRVNRLLTRSAFSAAALVTVGSAYLQDLASSALPPHRLTRLPLGIDPRMFHPRAGASRGPPREPWTLLNVASLVPVKGQAILLQAFASALRDHPGIRLGIVGDGPLRTTLEGLAADLDISRDVTFHGAVEHDEMPRYYRSADLVVQSSLHESQGMAVVEALGCGTPVLGTSVGILPELAPRRSPVPPGDPAALADAIRAGLRELESGGVPSVPLPDELRVEATGRNFTAIYRRVAAAR